MHKLFPAVLTLAVATPVAHAQFQIDWYTVDSGGGSSSGGTFSLTGTIGQHDTGIQTGGVFNCAGGFWAGTLGIAVCYANCDSSSVAPVLNANDFQCFLNSFAANAPYANCDQSTVNPILNANDFQCFLNAFAAGCS